MSHEVDINRADVFLVVYSKEQEWDANTRSIVNHLRQERVTWNESQSLGIRASHLE